MDASLLNHITVTNVIGANRLLDSPQGSSIYRHNRTYWAVALKAHGKTIYTMNGREILSDADHPVLLPKGASYHWKCVEPGECLIIEFDAEGPTGEIESFHTPENNFIPPIFGKIEHNLSLQPPDCQLECRYQLYKLLRALSRSARREYIPSGKQQLLQPALDYIAKNYSNPHITNDLLAELCGISTVYFRKTFEKVYSVPAMRYLQNLRIAKAKALLSSDFESISQVAESIGYASIYHFSKTFRQHTGMSPSQYARNFGEARTP